jgi:alkylated DNA nucleotide flippase Atl1
MSNASPLLALLCDVVGCVPYGRVVSYGVVARVVSVIKGSTISAQCIGWQLTKMPQHQRDRLPWRRVIASNGYISALKL